jgi:hypothetical protein
VIFILTQILNQAGSGKLLLVTIVQHALWAAGAVDSVSARLAFQTLQTLAIYQGKRANTEKAFSPTVSGIFPKATERILEMLLFPAR